MRARITGSLRERAAQICSMMAAYRASDLDYCGPVPADVYIDTPEMGLAWDAFSASHSCDSLTEYWAEAEAMLRTGWSP